MNYESIPLQVGEFINSLKNEKDILGIILFGSWARGNNRPDSDIDLIVITNNKVERDIRYVEGYALELVLTTEAAAKEFWKSNMNDCADLWSYAQILFDPYGVMERLRLFAQNLLLTPKPAVEAWRLKHVRYELEDCLKTIEKFRETNALTAHLLLQKTVLTAIEFYFDKNAIWTPPPKLRLPVLEQKDNILFALIAEFYRNAGAVISEQQIRLTHEIIRRLFA